ncbi:MAG: bifunctional phosphopantothenoylcysteine decarboxylase/phosphopantothenate--cysteine ligase CoaBC [candidate division WOR-3 bacterium]
MKVVVGVSGSIAAHKALLLCRELYKRGYEIKVILTKGALNFVLPLPFKELANAEVFTDEDFFKGNTHINLSRWAETFVIVPATYNIIGKVANGIADDLLTSAAASYKGPLVFIPAMHTEMWRNPILKENINRLKSFGHIVFPTVEGALASGDYGEGRMVEVGDILSFLEDIRKLRDLWKGKRVVITYGGTMESIDDVRVITNKSSGKMGISLATYLKALGSYVVAVGCGGVDVAPSDEFYRVYTVEELYNALKDLDYDYLFMAAAVSDFKPSYQKGKIKKEVEKIILELSPNLDVLKEITKHKRGKVVGFALEERGKLVEEAKRKLFEKNLDYIVANPVEVIGGDTTEVVLISQKGVLGEFKGTKWEVAREIIMRLSSE